MTSTSTRTDDLRARASGLRNSLRKMLNERALAEYDEIVEAALRTQVLQPTAPGGATGAYDEAEESYKIGVRDGFEEGVQNVAWALGLDGEYRSSSDPERHVPDPKTMIERIVEHVEARAASTTPEGLDREAVADRIVAEARNIASHSAMGGAHCFRVGERLRAIAEDLALRPTPTGDGDVEALERAAEALEACAGILANAGETVAEMEALVEAGLARAALAAFNSPTGDGDVVDDAKLREILVAVGEAADDPFVDWQMDLALPVLRAALAASKAQGGTETAKQQDPRRAIRFALAIDDHYDRREFLECWIHGDLSPWPEFAEGAERPKDEDEDDLPAAPPPATNVGA